MVTGAFPDISLIFLNALPEWFVTYREKMESWETCGALTRRNLTWQWNSPFFNISSYLYIKKNTFLLMVRFPAMVNLSVCWRVAGRGVKLQLSCQHIHIMAHSERSRSRSSSSKEGSGSGVCSVSQKVQLAPYEWWRLNVKIYIPFYSSKWPVSPDLWLDVT